MGLQTMAIRYILYILMSISLFLVQPYFLFLKKWIVKKYSFLIRATVLKQLFLGMFLMVGLTFGDSVYRWNRSDSLLLAYQTEKNFYLSGFALFLLLLFNKLCKTLEETYKAFDLNKDYAKQSDNSLQFINKVVEDVKMKTSTNEALLKEIEDLKSEIEENKGLIAEIKSNREAYSKLLRKYDILKGKKI